MLCAKPILRRGLSDTHSNSMRQRQGWHTLHAFIYQFSHTPLAKKKRGGRSLKGCGQHPVSCPYVDLPHRKHAKEMCGPAHLRSPNPGAFPLMCICHVTTKCDSRTRFLNPSGEGWGSERFSDAFAFTLALESSTHIHCNS